MTYEFSGGSSNLSIEVITTGAPTFYGWLAQWNTTWVPIGTYSLKGVACCGCGTSGMSQHITITVSN